MGNMQIRDLKSANARSWRPAKKVKCKCSAALAAAAVHLRLCFWSAAAADRCHLLVRGRPRRPISLQTEVRGNTSGETRWARQLTGQTGASTSVFCVRSPLAMSMRAAPKDVVHLRSQTNRRLLQVVSPAGAVMLKESFGSKDGRQRRSIFLPYFVLRCLQMVGTQLSLAGEPSGRPTTGPEAELDRPWVSPLGERTLFERVTVGSTRSDMGLTCFARKVPHATSVLWEAHVTVPVQSNVGASPVMQGSRAQDLPARPSVVSMMEFRNS